MISGTAPASVTIDANATTATLTVATADDALDEAASAITAALSAGTGYTVGSPASATVTVNDNDAEPSVSLASAAETVAEGAGPLTLTVSLDAASGREVTVDYATANVTATAGEDYTETLGTLTFDAGETAKTITVPILDDAVDDDDETFTVTLSSASNATLGSTSTTTVTITDDDEPAVPVVTVTPGTSPVPEGTAATFTVTRPAAGTAALTVNLTVTETQNMISGTAPASVTIDANATTATLTVATADDALDEAASAITAALSAGYGLHGGFAGFGDGDRHRQRHTAGDVGHADADGG